MLQALLKAIIALFIQKKPVQNVPVPAPIPVPEPVKPIPVKEPEVIKYLWNTPQNARHSVRVICDEMGLSKTDKDDLCRTVQCESGFNPKCVQPNIVDGKVQTTDYGICQINDYWHIGKGKSFPSVDYVMNNPEACIRWMCKMWKTGEKGKRLWVCYSKGLYKKYV